MVKRRILTKKFFLVFSMFLLLLLIKFFVADIMKVKGCSMIPTFKESGDMVVLNRLNHYTNSYERGDIVIAKNPDDKCIIKRIIGIPGDIIEIMGGKVYVNKELISEEYLIDSMETPAFIPVIDINAELKVKVPEGKVFFMGDNRGNSKDSRRYGCIDYSSIMGKVIMKFRLRDFEVKSLV